MTENSSTETPAATPRPPIEAAKLRELVPVQVGAWRRKSLSSPAERRRGAAEEGASAVARFTLGGLEATLKVSDLAGLSGIARLVLPGVDPVERDDETGRVKNYREGENTVREFTQRDGSYREVTLILSNGIIVSAESELADFAMLAEISHLKQLVDGIDPRRAGALRPLP